MFTVLVKNKKTGDEMLYSCEYVNFFRQPSEACDPGLCLMWKDGSSTHIGMAKEPDPFKFDVFVMNAAGQTVARYAV